MSATYSFCFRPKVFTGVCFALACVLGFSALGSRAADRYVTPPGGYGTNDTAGGYTNWQGAATNIQWAVNVATNGEKVWVTNGTYVLTNQITTKTNGVTIIGVNGNYPNTTNRCFLVTNADVVIDGFTITNGYVVTNSPLLASGGGVYLATNSTIQNCTITGNRAYAPTNDTVLGGKGGGVYMKAGKVLNCTVSGNYCDTLASGGYDKYGGGGGIYIWNNGLVSNCIIVANVSTGASVVAQAGGSQNTTWRQNDICIGITTNIMLVQNNNFREQ